MAGMIREQTKQQINGIPGLMQLPVLGALFKSRDYVNQQTELMVIVTPLCGARGGAEGPVAAGRRLCRCQRPGGAFCSASSTASTASPARAPRRSAYQGQYGFILD